MAPPVDRFTASADEQLPLRLSPALSTTIPAPRKPQPTPSPEPPPSARQAVAPAVPAAASEDVGLAVEVTRLVPASGNLTVRRRKGTANTLAALRSIRAARPDGAPVYVMLDNLSAHNGKKILRWAKNNNVHLCFTPTNASWANPIEAHFGPLRQFTLANSNYPNHTVQTRALHAYLRWRNANARHPDVLAAQRKERARIRSEKGLRWGGRTFTEAA